MKILVLSFYFRPDLSAGSFRTAALVRALKTLSPGVKIHVVTTLPNRYHSFAVDAPEHELLDGILVTRIALPAHESGMFDQAKAFLKFARSALRTVDGNHYDLIYATSSRLMTAVFGAWISRRKRCPLYLDLRDIFADTIKDILPKRVAGLSRHLFSFIERWAVTQATSVNLVSLGFRTYFSSRYPRQRLTFFSNGIDDEFMGAAPVEASPIRTPRVLHVLYAGNIGEGQGLHAIVPELACRCEGRARFTIYGDGGRKALLMERLSALNVTNVVIRPPVTRDQLINAYRTADVLFLHLGNYDAFTKVLPSKVFEYAALGKAVLAGISGYSAEFVRQEIDNAEVFSPGDVDGAMQALDRLVIQDRPRSEFVKKYARENISCEMASDILSIARSIASL